MTAPAWSRAPRRRPPGLLPHSSTSATTSSTTTSPPRYRFVRDRRAGCYNHIPAFKRWGSAKRKNGKNGEQGMSVYPRIGGRLIRPTPGMISAAARVMALARQGRRAAAPGARAGGPGPPRARPGAHDPLPAGRGAAPHRHQLRRLRPLPGQGGGGLHGHGPHPRERRRLQRHRPLGGGGRLRAGDGLPRPHHRPPRLRQPAHRHPRRLRAPGGLRPAQVLPHEPVHRTRAHPQQAIEDTLRGAGVYLRPPGGAGDDAGRPEPLHGLPPPPGEGQGGAGDQSPKCSSTTSGPSATPGWTG